MATARAAIGASAVMCIMHMLPPLAACDDPASHPYAARPYDGTRDCLLAPVAIEVVEGADPGECSPACLLANDDGARTAYVATKCAPYPPRLDASGEEPACAAALEAFARGDLCLSDGGSTRPRDAGGG